MSVFDIECDGFNPTKIHCLSYEVLGECYTITNYDDMREWLLSQPTLIGHNILRFDIPVVERILGVKIGARLVDTLALAWYLEPDRPRHNLESYGEDFGVPKPVIDDWEGLSLEEYAHRCEEDVKINRLLYLKQRKHLEMIYEDTKEVVRLENYLTFKMECAAIQEQTRWKLDVPHCEALLTRWLPEFDNTTRLLAEAMPAVPTYAVMTRPKKPYKQDGSESVLGRKWFHLLKSKGLPKDYMDSVKLLVGEAEPNPNSHVQIKEWLYSLGWEPCTFKYKRDKETNEVRKIPQVYNEHDPEVTPSVRELFNKEPSLKLLDGRSVLSHRINIIKKFLQDVDEDGYLKARIQGFTNTLRFKHTEIVNLPGVDKPYGKDIRGALIAPEGWELCGSDQEALEDKTKQHYMYDYDPDYVNEMQRPGFDPHLDMARADDQITTEEMYAVGAKDTYKQLRKKYKAVNYAAVYGASAPTIARQTGGSEHEAKKLIDLYWRRNWAVKSISEALTVKKVKGQLWLLNPVSGFWYSLRAQKDRFSTLNQGTGVYCFDMWVRAILKRRKQITGQFHDEIVQCIRKGHREECELLLRGAIEEVNNKLNLNVKLNIDVQFGDSYADIH